MVSSNPIELVRQSGRRLCIPRVLTVVEVRLLLEQLAEPYHTMVLVAACLGLRVSEIIGLRWGDFGWDNMTVMIQRSVVQCQVGETKTEGSSRPLPINPGLAAHLRELHKGSPYNSPGDWVFANDAGKPRWQETILHRQLKPAAYARASERLAGTRSVTPTQPCCAVPALTSRCSRNCCDMPTSRPR